MIVLKEPFRQVGDANRPFARPSQRIRLVVNGWLPYGSVTRASKAWEWNAQGNIQEYANNTPVIGYDPSDNSLRGLTIRKAWTNSLLDNRDLTTANWGSQFGTVGVAINATGADGTANSANTLTDSDGTAAVCRRQDITISNDSATHTVSVLFKKDSDETRFPGIQWLFFGGTSITEGVNINTKTGADDETDSDGSYSVIDRGDWWEITATLTNNSTGNTTARLRIYPARTDSLGTVAVNSATGSVIYDFGGIYLNSSYAGPPIITGSAAVTREADDITVTSIPWFNASEGTILTSVTKTNDINANTFVIFSFNDGSNNNRTRGDINSSDTRYLVSDGGVSQANIASSDNRWADSNLPKTSTIGYVYKANDFALYEAGSQIGTDSSGSLPDITQLEIGNQSSSNYLEGWIKELIYHPSRLPNATLVSLSGS